MAYSQDGNLVTYTSDADYSADGTGQYRGVKITSTGVVLCGANDAAFLGVLQNDPKSGAAATVKVQDTSKAIAGGAITNGAKVTTDAAGRFVAATTGQNVCGRARSAAAASGDQFSLLIQPGGLA
jgi:hypothetical protein